MALTAECANPVEKLLTSCGGAVQNDSTANLLKAIAELREEWRALAARDYRAGVNASDWQRGRQLLQTSAVLSCCADQLEVAMLAGAVDPVIATGHELTTREKPTP